MNKISVCIATHRRPDGLRKLLQSLVDQVEAPAFNVIVVDNDSRRTASRVAENFNRVVSLRYLLEPERGLARVRNRAVAASDATYIAFIDDDEWAFPEWLACLFAVATGMGPDVVIGPVRVSFGPEVPDCIRACEYFEESLLPDGAIVPWYLTRTSNALVRRAALPDLERPFSTKFDLTGGEDIDLFQRMIAMGAVVRAARGALVHEHRPVQRANLRWIARRAVRNGANRAENNWRGASLARLLWRGTRAGVRSIRSAVAASVLWGIDRNQTVRHVINASESAGHVAHVLGLRVEEYRHHS